MYHTFLSMSVEKSSSKYPGFIRLPQQKVILLVPCINMTATTTSHRLTIDYFLRKLEFSEHLRKRIRKVIVIVIRNWVHFLNHCLHWHHQKKKKHIQKTKCDKSFSAKNCLMAVSIPLPFWLGTSFNEKNIIRGMKSSGSTNNTKTQSLSTIAA